MFKEGFAFGADPAHARKRHAIVPITERYWRMGFEAGQAAAKRAAAALTAGLLYCRCGHLQSRHSDDDNAGPCVAVDGDLGDSEGFSVCTCRKFKAGAQRKEAEPTT